MTGGLRPQTRAWLGQPALERFWRGVHERLERNGMQAKGRLSLKDVSDQERDAVALLMGRPYTGPALSIALAELDGQLRSSAAERGLIEVVVELRGPLTDRPALRDKRRAASETVWGSARRALHERGLDGLGWVVTWLDDVRRGGALARLDPDQGARLIVQAVEALVASARSVSPRSRGAASSPNGSPVPRTASMTEPCSRGSSCADWPVPTMPSRLGTHGRGAPSGRPPG